jgi:hypothetical protein
VRTCEVEQKRRIQPSLAQFAGPRMAYSAKGGIASLPLMGFF